MVTIIILLALTLGAGLLVGTRLPRAKAIPAGGRPLAHNMNGWDRALIAVRWMKDHFAEWFIGSWALILGWGIVGVIFANLLAMDGHFSRGLGEGSGVDPGLFQHIGWMFRVFAATFLVLCVRFEQAKLHATAVKLKGLGTVCTVIVIAHAAGFGLTALEEKRAAAVAVEQTASTSSSSTATVIATLERQKESIQVSADRNVANLQGSIQRILEDHADNDDLANPYREDQKLERDNARTAIARINAKITELTLAEAQASTDAVSAVTKAKSQKWSPLFVGLAQLFTFSQNPSDWAIYLCGVFFMIAWVLLADAIVIGVPPALYKLHLEDAKRKQRAEAGAKGGNAAVRAANKRYKAALIEFQNREPSKHPDARGDAQPHDPDDDTDEKGLANGDDDPAQRNAAE